jgi:hypothetical protein
LSKISIEISFKGKFEIYKTNGLTDGNFEKNFNVNFNFCKIEKSASSNFIIKRIIAELTNKTNIPVKCPYKKVENQKSSKK